MSYLSHQLDKIPKNMYVSLKMANGDNETKWLHVSPDQVLRIKRILLEDELKEEREGKLRKVKNSLSKIGQ